MTSVSVLLWLAVYALAGALLDREISAWRANREAHVRAMASWRRANDAWRQAAADWDEAIEAARDAREMQDVWLKVLTEHQALLTVEQRATLFRVQRKMSRHASEQRSGGLPDGAA